MTPKKQKTPEELAHQRKGLRRGGKKGKRSGTKVIELSKFCAAYIANNENLNPTVRALKIGKSAAYRCLNDPKFSEVIVQARAEFTRQSAKEAAKKSVREITIDRNDIIMGLADIAQLGESERARVAAFLGLADIYMLRAKNVRDTSKFFGWTADELEHFAITGQIPERFRSTLGPSGSAESSLRTEKN